MCISLSYSMLWGQRSTWGHLGSRGSKGHATSTDYIRHGHVTHAFSSAGYPLQKSKNLGSFGVTRVKRPFSPKMLLLQITCLGHEAHAYALPKYTLMIVAHPRRASCARSCAQYLYSSTSRGRGHLRL